MEYGAAVRRSLVVTLGSLVPKTKAACFTFGSVLSVKAAAVAEPS